MDSYSDKPYDDPGLFTKHKVGGSDSSDAEATPLLEDQQTTTHASSTPPLVPPTKVKKDKDIYDELADEVMARLCEDPSILGYIKKECSNFEDWVQNRIFLWMDQQATLPRNFEVTSAVKAKIENDGIISDSEHPLSMFNLSIYLDGGGSALSALGHFFFAGYFAVAGWAAIYFAYRWLRAKEVRSFKYYMDCFRKENLDVWLRKTLDKGEFSQEVSSTDFTERLAKEWEFFCKEKFDVWLKKKLGNINITEQIVDDQEIKNSVKPIIADLLRTGKLNLTNNQLEKYQLVPMQHDLILLTVDFVFNDEADEASLKKIREKIDITKPHLIKDADGNYRIWGFNGDKWGFSDDIAADKIPIPQEWDDYYDENKCWPWRKHKVFVDPGMGIFEVLEQAHTPLAERRELKKQWIEFECGEDGFAVRVNGSGFKPISWDDLPRLEGCEYYLMSAPEPKNYDNYKKSNQEKLYLYKDGNRVFYYREDDQKKYYMETSKWIFFSDPLIFPEGAEFNSAHDNPVPFKNGELGNELGRDIFRITSDRGHTLQIPRDGSEILSNKHAFLPRIRKVIGCAEDKDNIVAELMDGGKPKLAGRQIRKYKNEIDLRPKSQSVDKRKNQILANNKSFNKEQIREYLENGYNLAPMSKNKDLEEDVIEFKSKKNGLHYRIFGLDKQVKTGTILWKDLPREFLLYCNLFLMANPDNGVYEKSDQQNFYFYKDNEGVFYYVEEDPDRKHYLQDKAGQYLVLPDKFTSGKEDWFKEKLNDIDNELSKKVIDSTARKRHTISLDEQILARKAELLPEFVSLMQKAGYAETDRFADFAKFVDKNFDTAKDIIYLYGEKERALESAGKPQDFFNMLIEIFSHENPIRNTLSMFTKWLCQQVVNAALNFWQAWWAFVLYAGMTAANGIHMPLIIILTNAQYLLQKIVQVGYLVWEASKSKDEVKQDALDAKEEKQKIKQTQKALYDSMVEQEHGRDMDAACEAFDTSRKEKQQRDIFRDIPEAKIYFKPKKKFADTRLGQYLQKQRSKLYFSKLITEFVATVILVAFVFWLIASIMVAVAMAGPGIGLAALAHTAGFSFINSCWWSGLVGFFMGIVNTIKAAANLKMSDMQYEQKVESKLYVQYKDEDKNKLDRCEELLPLTEWKKAKVECLALEFLLEKNKAFLCSELGNDKYQSINDSMVSYRKKLMDFSEDEDYSLDYKELVALRKDLENKLPEEDIFLMAAPDEDVYDKYAKSDEKQKQLYLYKDDEGKVFYYHLQDRKRYYLINNKNEDLVFPDEAEFITKNEDWIKTKYINKELNRQVLKITSDRGHTPNHNPRDLLDTVSRIDFFNSDHNEKLRHEVPWITVLKKMFTYAMIADRSAQSGSLWWRMVVLSGGILVNGATITFSGPIGWALLGLWAFCSLGQVVVGIMRYYNEREREHNENLVTTYLDGKLQYMENQDELLDTLIKGYENTLHPQEEVQEGNDDSLDDEKTITLSTSTPSSTATSTPSITETTSNENEENKTTSNENEDNNSGFQIINLDILAKVDNGTLDVVQTTEVTSDAFPEAVTAGIQAEISSDDNAVMERGLLVQPSAKAQENKAPDVSKDARISDRDMDAVRKMGFFALSSVVTQEKMPAAAPVKSCLPAASFKNSVAIKVG